jgi:DNA-binding response OmpR family regulator
LVQPLIFVVEDDAAIRAGLVDALEYQRYRVQSFADGRSARLAVVAQDPALVLLDVVLPEMDGFQLLEEIRVVKPSLAVIMVTARGAEVDRVAGLKTGADDYVVKPFSAIELLARVEAVLRRSAERPRAVGHLQCDGREVDLARQRVTLADGTERPLSEKEVAILRYLAASQGRIVSRNELLQRVWGLDPRGIETRTVDMHVARLREKLDDRDPDQRIIQTIRAQGYVLSDRVLTSQVT